MGGERGRRFRLLLGFLTTAAAIAELGYFVVSFAPDYITRYMAPQWHAWHINLALGSLQAAFPGALSTLLDIRDLNLADDRCLARRVRFRPSGHRAHRCLANPQTANGASRRHAPSGPTPKPKKADARDDGRSTLHQRGIRFYLRESRCRPRLDRPPAAGKSQSSSGGPDGVEVIGGAQQPRSISDGCCCRTARKTFRMISVLG
jgi:hypothetical protein